jgi:hypothetical protein
MSAFGETNSNPDVSKLGPEPCESRDEAIDLSGEFDLAPSELCLCGGEYDDSVDDVVIFDLCDVRWSNPPFLTNWPGIWGLGGSSGVVTEVRVEP